MNQRYDLAAFSLLAFSAVLTIWLTAGPLNFALKDWQPLIASFVALGAAVLAYKAAMAKVDFDRETAERVEKRKALGLCLRLEFAMRVLRHQAEILEGVAPFDKSKRDITIDMAKTSLPMPEAIVEAWANLDSFPRSLSQRLADVRGIIYDFHQFKNAVDDAVWNVPAFTKAPPEVQRLNFIARELANSTVIAMKEITDQIAVLRR